MVANAAPFVCVLSECIPAGYYQGIAIHPKLKAIRCKEMHIVATMPGSRAPARSWLVSVLMTSPISTTYNAAAIKCLDKVYGSGHRENIRYGISAGENPRSWLR